MCGSIPICCVCLKTSLEYIDLETPFDVTDEQAEDLILGMQLKTPLLNKKHTKILTYLDCFKECTRLDVIKDDKRTQSLCSGCGLELKIAYEFIRKAINAAKILEQGEFVEVAARRVEKSESLAVIDEENLGEDDMTEFSEYEEILDETNSMIKIDYDLVNDDIYAEEDEIAELTCEICLQSFQSHNLLSKHKEVAHDVLLENFMDHESTDQYENDDNSSLIEVTLASQEELQYESVGKSEVQFHLEVRTNDENSAIQSYTSSCEEFSVSGDYKDDTIKANELKEEKPLKLHHRTKHKVESDSITESCEVCKKTFIKSDQKQKGPQRCIDCGAAEETISKVFEIDQKDDQSKNFLCNICSKTFATNGILNAHLKYHQRKEANIKSDACNICGKQFSTKHYLRLHMQVHTNDRTLHKCGQCDKLYVTKTALDNHMKLHKGDTIKCILCSKEFSRQYELNVHMRFHTRDYPFECETCGKKFAIKGHLRTHMWRHQGLKLQCEDCGKLFTSSKALQEHSFTHSEMPFPCSYCAKAYPSRQKYKVHLRTAHSLDLNEEELQKISRNISQKPLFRKKLTLVQADSVMKEIEVKDEDNEEVQDFVITLF